MEREYGVSYADVAFGRSPSRSRSPIPPSSDRSTTSGQSPLPNRAISRVSVKSILPETIQSQRIQEGMPSIVISSEIQNRGRSRRRKKSKRSKSEVASPGSPMEPNSSAEFAETLVVGCNYGDECSRPSFFSDSDSVMESSEGHKADDVDSQIRNEGSITLEAISSDLVEEFASPETFSGCRADLDSVSFQISSLFSVEAERVFHEKLEREKKGKRRHRTDSCA